MTTRRALSRGSVGCPDGSCLGRLSIDIMTVGTFEETSMPVVDYYRKKGNVVEVSQYP
jgi:hypothetical protein